MAAMEKHNGDPRLHDATRLSDLGIEKVWPMGHTFCRDATKLSDLGIEKTQSHRWQRIAAKCGATTTFAGVGNGNVA